VAARIPLKRQLVFVLVLPALMVLAGVSFFADRAMRHALDKSLGQNLIAIARSSATIIDDRVALLEKGDDELRIVKRTQKKIAALITASEVERILILSKSPFTILVDSSEKLQIGDDYSRASFDQLELEQTTQGKSVASTLFQGTQGRWYKSAYAPLGKNAVVVVHAPAGFFNAIDQLRTLLLTSLVSGLIILLILSLISARRVTIPLSKLTEAAEDIGKGKLQTPIPKGGPVETQILGNTMAKMATSLHRRDEELQMMLGGIAHEVRNPLGGIELFGSLLKEDLEGDEDKLPHVEKILKEIRVLSNVVNDFLNFARKQELNLKRVRLHDLLVDVRNMASMDSAKKSVSVKIEAEKQLNAELDHQTMHAALLNLLRNAIQASPENGEVEMIAHALGDQLVLEVSDQGEGIPAEKVDQVFTPFFTTKQQGTGLGLALVQKAIRNHDGQIVYEDRAPKGALFRVTLPAKASFEDFSEPGLLG